MEFQVFTEEYDAALAAIIGANLKAHHLDIPGTACFDLTDDGGAVGGIGLAETAVFPGLL